MFGLFSRKQDQVKKAPPPTPPSSCGTPSPKAQPANGKSPFANKVSKIEGIDAIIAVASGKGGVGKSSTSWALAHALVDQKETVGLLDADVYGPSLKHLTNAENAYGNKNNQLVPYVDGDIKTLSVGMMGSPEQAHVLRGPMASGVVKQMLTGTAWGNVNKLILDYPPGTGDIQLSIAQTVDLTGVVIVTTPQELAYLDVRKAISMFQSMRTPIIGIIETMSYFVCDGCDKKHHIFPEGTARKLAKEFGLSLLAEIPMEPAFSAACDMGDADKLKQTASWELYKQAAARISGAVNRLQAT